MSKYIVETIEREHFRALICYEESPFDPTEMTDAYTIAYDNNGYRRNKHLLSYDEEGNCYDNADSKWIPFPIRASVSSQASYFYLCEEDESPNGYIFINKYHIGDYQEQARVYLKEFSYYANGECYRIEIERFNMNTNQWEFEECAEGYGYIITEEYANILLDDHEEYYKKKWNESINYYKSILNGSRNS